jgi:hypothetical protein
LVFCAQVENIARQSCFKKRCEKCGLAVPSTSRPFSQREVPLYKEGDFFGLNGTVEVNLEGYFHDNQSYVPFEIWILNSAYATMALTLKKDPFVAEDPAVNITGYGDRITGVSSNGCPILQFR